MTVDVTETGLWYNIITANKISWRLFRRSILMRAYKNEIELKLIPEKSGDICVEQWGNHFKGIET